jgi:hypothetical protein
LMLLATLSAFASVDGVTLPGVDRAPVGVAVARVAGWCGRGAVEKRR